MNEIIKCQKNNDRIKFLLWFLEIIFGTLSSFCFLNKHFFIAILFLFLQIGISVFIVLVNKYLTWLEMILNDTSFYITKKTALKMQISCFYEIYQIKPEKWKVDELCYYEIAEKQECLFGCVDMIYKKRVYIYFNIIDYFKFTKFVKNKKREKKQKEIEKQIKEDLQLNLQFLDSVKKDLKSYQNKMESEIQKCCCEFEAIVNKIGGDNNDKRG